jgi:hypothetical protein
MTRGSPNSATWTAYAAAVCSGTWVSDPQITGTAAVFIVGT